MWRAIKRAVGGLRMPTVDLSPVGDEYDVIAAARLTPSGDVTPLMFGGWRSWDGSGESSWDD